MKNKFVYVKYYSYLCLVIREDHDRRT